MKYQYFTHIHVKGPIYRFKVGSNTGGQLFNPTDDSQWWGYVIRVTSSNWTRISRDKARKICRKAFN